MTEAPSDDPDSPQDIILANDAWRVAPFMADEAESTVAEALVTALQEAKLPADAGLTILLADDEALQRLNADHRGKDTATNVLSFPAAEPGEAPIDGHYGDIAIALETVLAEAREAEISPAAHLAHMVVHGVLHLAGFDHIDDAEAEIMEAMEVQALKRIGVRDPYADSELTG
jgi:probable rRNA maturation factor